MWLTQIFVCILDLDIWEPSQRAQGSYLGTIKELNEIILNYLMICLMIILMMVIINIMMTWIYIATHINLYILC